LEAEVHPRRRGKDFPSQRLAQAVAAKLEDGNLRAAIRILVSDDAPAEPSLEGLAKLQEKHPPASLIVSEIPIPQEDSHMTVAEADVLKAVMSFPAGSSGGPDGFRPQHLKDLLNCRETGTNLLSALTAFTNMVLAGRCPRDMAPVFFGGRLIALDKKSGGIRPIAVGFTLRRLTSKCANSAGIYRLSSVFAPRQLGVGVPGGCEAAVHSARRFLETMPKEQVLVKLDFTNAFNSLHRKDMLLAVKERLPEIYPYCFSAYSSPSLLFHGRFTLLSAEGPQQGDPLGPLLFCNTEHPLLASLGSELTLGFLDDLTLGGEQGSVAADVGRIDEVGRDMGLALNISKCELIAHPDTIVTDPLLQSFRRRPVEEASLLGAPLLPGPALDSFWEDRCADLTRAVDRLCSIGSQDALLLLRASFSAPRVQHLLRCSPSVDHPSLATFDIILRSGLDRITNVKVSDIQWIQATMPVKDGGLGMRRVSSLALPAYLASAASTLSLQEDILRESSISPDRFLQTYEASWTAAYGSPPAGTLSFKQSAWDRPGVMADRTLVEAGLAEPRLKASYLAATAPHSGDWLWALPIASCGLRLEDEAVRVAVALRLGLDICVPHDCRCGTRVDTWGIHATTCKQAPGRIMRHHALNEILTRAFASAGVPAMKEPSCISRSDGKRPDGLTLIPWRGGKPLTWDVTVASTLAQSYISASAGSYGAASELAAERKRSKYADIPPAYSFQPVAMETLGAIEPSAVDFLNDIGRRITAISGEPRESFYLFQRISVTLQRFNAVLLHDTFVGQDDPDP
jgi:hypothetical protein